MLRLAVFLIMLFCAAPALAAGNNTAPRELKDLYFGEALYYAFQEEWFDAIARLDTELGQFRGLDEPELDTLYSHINLVEFDVGDFELAYRMHHRAGRAIKGVIEGNVDEEVRNEAIYRLARIFFQKDQPVNALHSVERISGKVPVELRDDLAFLRAQILMANGRFTDAEKILRDILGAKGLEGFTTYNLAIALLRNGKTKEGLQHLERSGRIDSVNPVTQAIRDKSNLVLADKLMKDEQFETAKQIFDRVRLEGPFSNRSLLGSGWADTSREQYERALVPWTLLSKRAVTDSAVQEGLLALPYAYGKLGVYGKAALLYGRALEVFGSEVDKLDASIKSIREGKFLKALVREELKQDTNWVIKLRELPETPETYYLITLMASHDFQESLKNYLDLEDLRKRLVVWAADLDAFEEIIEIRRAYYQPLLPVIDGKFRRLDSQMRLRLEQRDRIEQRLQAMLVAPRPDYLATARERILGERIARLERLAAAGKVSAPDLKRIRRLRGVLNFTISTEYDQRFTEAHKNLRDLNQVIDAMHKQYTSFVRTRQAATQSYQGYEDSIRRRRIQIRAAQEKVDQLMARQGNMLETMAVNELTRRRDRLEEFQVKARFAMADSYDRAIRKEAQEEKAP